VFTHKRVREERISETLETFRTTDGSLQRHAWNDPRTGLRVEIGGSANSAPEEDQFGIRQGYIAINDREGEPDYPELEEMGIDSPNIHLAKIKNGEVILLKNKKTTEQAERVMQSILQELRLPVSETQKLDKRNYLTEVKKAVVVPWLLKKHLAKLSQRELAKIAAGWPELIIRGIDKQIGERGWKKYGLSDLVRGAKYAKETGLREEIRGLEQRIGEDISEREAVDILIKNHPKSRDLQKALLFLGKNTWSLYLGGAKYIEKTIDERRSLPERINEMDRRIRSNTITDREAVKQLMNEFDEHRSLQSALSYLGRSAWADYLRGAKYVDKTGDEGRSLKDRVEELEQRIREGQMVDEDAARLLMREYSDKDLKRGLLYLGKASWSDVVRGRKVYRDQ
jgi:hypothetical protein